MPRTYRRRFGPERRFTFQAQLFWTSWTFDPWWSIGTINRNLNIAALDVGPLALRVEWRRRFARGGPVR